jgi:MFS family permease
MLGSITPLGERGRGSRWWLTVSAYIVGSIAGGAAVGGLLGAIGAAVEWSIATRLLVLAVAAVAGVLFDVGVGGLRLPTVHRQVDEEWRTRYRGWVWGIAFGFQLALGVVTIVTTSLVYVTLFGAFLAGSVASGVWIGVAFGLARAAPVFTVARVRRPTQLSRVDETLRRLAHPARRAAIAAGGGVAVLAVAGALP